MFRSVGKRLGLQIGSRWISGSQVLTAVDGMGELSKVLPGVLDLRIALDCWIIGSLDHWCVGY